jgi:hypothetical protein
MRQKLKSQPESSKLPAKAKNARLTRENRRKEIGMWLLQESGKGQVGRPEKGAHS